MTHSDELMPVRTASKKEVLAEVPCVVNFGCRLNAAESETMESCLYKHDLQNDIIVVNTCAVTNEAVRQVKQYIRRLKREYPERLLVVTGCAATIDPKVFKEELNVDCVVPNYGKESEESFLEAIKTLFLLKNKPFQSNETYVYKCHQKKTRTREFVEIQNGCDHQCTFCIVPYARGFSRSRSPHDIVHKIDELVKKKGTAEVVLTGVDITSYWHQKHQMTFSHLLAFILYSVPELKRLRLSSVDVAKLDQDFFNILAREERLMPHIHLSLQSGDTLILKRMRRRHTRDDIIKFCSHAREVRNDVVFGADIIAGFPTETDAMFRNTLDIIDLCDLLWLHIFPFSPKTGTPAARMPQIHVSVIKERASILREKAHLKKKVFLKAQHGKCFQILAEKKDMGRTVHFIPIKLIEDERNKNNFSVGGLHNVCVVDSCDDHLFAKYLDTL